MDMARAPCIQIRVVVRRIQRHPITQRTIRSGNLIKKHVVRGATLGLIPDALNDFAFHHAPVTVDEAVHILQDQMTISSMSAVMTLAMMVIRVEKFM
jgi:hypothetical protein